MRSLMVVVCLIGSALAAFGQSDRGTITGTITDPAGAVVASAAIEVQECRARRAVPGGEFGHRELRGPSAGRQL